MQPGKKRVEAREFHPVTRERWDDLVAFFQRQEHAGECWCTYWRLKSSEFNKLTAEQRREKMKSLVAADVPVGILGYEQGKPIAWCSVAPRETYAGLGTSITGKRLDDLAAWSVACFVVDPAFRGKGLPAELLRAGAAYAVAQGAAVVEGYPVPDRDYGFMGSPAAFALAGFREVATLKNDRKVVRFFAGENKTP